MRFSLARGAGSVAIAVLLSGCSNAPATQQALPAAMPLSPLAHAGKRPHYLHPDGPIGPIGAMRLLELQAAGELPGPAPAATMRHVLRDLRKHTKRPKLRGLPHDTAAVAIWALNGDYNYLIGQKKGGAATATAIDLEANKCVSPQSVHVDHAQNVWVGCEYNAPSSYGTILEYSAAGKLQDAYVPSCPAPASSCGYWYSYLYDSGTDGTMVYAAIPYSEECASNCTGSTNYEYGSGFEYWPAGDPSATPAYINVGEACAPVCNVDYMDLDSTGNIWFSYYGCTSTACGGALGKIANPTTNPKFVTILAAGAFDCPGSVYISNGGTILNYVDSCSRRISQYPMPVTSSSKPGKTFGPTPRNVFKVGQPMGLGFNAVDKTFVLGDADGWLDIGTIANHWKAVPSINLGDYVPGAAFTPSDK
jgi:hypothetical protein